MDVFYFVLEMEKTDVVESFYILLEDVGGEVVNVLEYFGLEFLDWFENLLVLFGNIGLEEETHDRRI